MAKFTFRVTRSVTCVHNEQFEIEAETYADARDEAQRSVINDDYIQKYPVDAIDDIFDNPPIEGERTLYCIGNSTQEYTQEHRLLTCGPKKRTVSTPTYNAPKAPVFVTMGYDRDMMEPPMDNY